MDIPVDNSDGRRVGRTGRTVTVLRRALAALLLAGAAVACGPDTGSGAAASLAPVAPSAAVSVQPSASPTPSASSSPLPGPSAPASESPSPSATRAARTPSAEPTEAPPTRAATAEPAQEPTQAEEAACEIVSDAGNCYKAGQFCRKADIGRETHGANGRLLHCRSEGTRARWNY
ncbi:hypothetical protein ACIA6C_09940 [Streptomyces sp. NPDC051578]|uniref:hypothetical protein n=1 Tax=Streptomyces sp. NPDC051578 TaxID=3365662 RepID=UPI0037AC6480